MSGQRKPNLPRNARAIALSVLHDVRTADAYANLALPAKLRSANLASRDAALATELSYGTLRLQRRYDAIIELAANRSTDEIDEVALDILRLGVHQLLTMGLAPHAAVDESVRLAKSSRAGCAAGFINAVLRKVSYRTTEEWRQLLSSQLSTKAFLGVWHSHPDWVVNQLEESLAAVGVRGRLEALLVANNTNPEVNYVAFHSTKDAPAGAVFSGPSPLGFQLPYGSPAKVLAANPRIRVQDQGSQLAGLALLQARDVPERGERWLDLCAGPGGKAALLAASAKENEFVANELVPTRARLVEQALAGLDGNHSVTYEDGRGFGKTSPGRFDRILLDAPCSGLGALRRRPEARWRKQPSDLPELVALQRDLLQSAYDALAPGGILAYITCSPVLAETRQQVDWMRAQLGAKPLDTGKILAGVVANGYEVSGREVQLFTDTHDTDCMFIALLTKPTL